MEETHLGAIAESIETMGFETKNKRLKGLVGSVLFWLDLEGMGSQGKINAKSTYRFNFHSQKKKKKRKLSGGSHLSLSLHSFASS